MSAEHRLREALEDLVRLIEARRPVDPHGADIRLSPEFLEAKTVLAQWWQAPANVPPHGR